MTDIEITKKFNKKKILDLCNDLDITDYELYGNYKAKINSVNGNKDGKVVFSKKLISLGVAMQLPPGFEAVVVPRSSTFSKFKVLLANSFGVIDNTYCGSNDIWAFNAIAFDKTVIHKGDRICQFKVQLSQKATWLQKLKWLFDSKVEFVPVEELQNPDRHGFGSTGTK